MAIDDDEIERHCTGPRPQLVRFVSPEIVDGEEHTLHLAYDINDLVQNSAKTDPRWGRARALLEAFAEGGPLATRRFGKNRDRKQPSVFAYLAPRRGEPDGIWEFRISVPGFEQLRIFGLFTRRNSFVALAFRDRDGLDYTEAMTECDDTWRQLFAPKEPHKGRSANDYFSNAQPVS